MSESKTQRTPVYQYSDTAVVKDGHTMFMQDACKELQWFQRKVEKLELENADLKAKLSEYERQVKDGELVTVHTIIEWILWEWDKLSDEAELQKSIQEYAVSRQKEGGK